MAADAEDPATEATAAPDGPTGWLFLAIDGYTGPVWERLDQATVVETFTLSHAHLASAPHSLTHSRLGAMPEVPIVCSTSSGETALVTTSPTGLVEVFVCGDGPQGAPFATRTAVDGVAVEALYAVLCARLGVPARIDSNAAG